MDDQDLILNLSPGPSALPHDVVKQLRDFLNSRLETGSSLIEISHRSSEFKAAHTRIKDLLRRLLLIPDDYTMLFLQGGARAHTSAIPMNFMTTQAKLPVYLNSGVWSALAAQEAKRYGDIETYSVPGVLPIERLNDADYCHYVNNETIDGIYWDKLPKLSHRRVICDMTSSLLSCSIPWSRLGCIYASSQKYLGLPGVTLVILDRKWLARITPMPQTPSTLNYQQQDQSDSLFNTPTNISWLTALWVLEWIESKGGLTYCVNNATHCAQLLYTFLDQSQFYQATVESHLRSKVNIVFKTRNVQSDQDCADYLAQKGVIGVKGHSLKGGLRASLYSTITPELIHVFIEHLKAFEEQYDAI